MSETWGRSVRQIRATKVVLTFLPTYMIDLWPITLNINEKPKPRHNINHHPSSSNASLGIVSQWFENNQPSKVGKYLRLYPRIVSPDFRILRTNASELKLSNLGSLNGMRTQSRTWNRRTEQVLRNPWKEKTTQWHNLRKKKTTPWPCF